MKPGLELGDATPSSKEASCDDWIVKCCVILPAANFS